MSEAVQIAIMGVMAAAIGGCYTLIYRHTNYCQKEVREKLVEIATNQQTAKEEITRLRDIRHEIMEHTTRALAEWHANIIERLTK